MTKVIFDISMSLDGYIAAPNDRPGEELGDGGQRLHAWLFDEATDTDREVAEETSNGAGAVISGARTVDICLDVWGGKPPSELPWFVLSHDKPERFAKANRGFNFVLDGVESAVDQAKSAAGAGYVLVMGGASAGQQCLQAGLVDEMQIHLAPVLFGNGIRLLENIDAERIGLETTRVIETPAATHLQYRIVRHPS